MIVLHKKVFALQKINVFHKPLPPNSVNILSSIAFITSSLEFFSKFNNFTIISSNFFNPVSTIKFAVISVFLKYRGKKSKGKRGRINYTNLSQ